jgi:hypothetical protein
MYSALHFKISHNKLECFSLSKHYHNITILVGKILLSELIVITLFGIVIYD